ncbi:MAG TPA: hypothetical protein VJ855_03005 [Marinilabiliaceae bacterium]|nr:hypothetical protein [Marinilabiliaceae bacterium]
MNKQHFIEVLKNPSLLSEKTLDPIKEILEEYPFFQAGRMLWIKNLHQLDHIRYNNELKFAAAHISDRARLFELIHDPVFIEKKEIADSEMAQEKVESHETIETPSKCLKTEAFEDANYFKVDDVFTTPEGTEYDYSHSEFNTAQGERDYIDNDLFEGEENIVLPTGDLLGYEYSGKEPYQLSDIPLPASINEARSFSEWLNILKQDHSFAQSGNKQAKEIPVKKKRNLIDSFLEQSSAKRIRLDSTSEKTLENVDISLGSVQEHDDLMTETLANIYIKQKQFLKAIDVFHRLSLKYPEKNIYFARRIKELEDQINNQ